MLWAWNGLPLNTYISLYAKTNRCYNERGSRTNYVRPSIPHCIYRTKRRHMTVTIARSSDLTVSICPALSSNTVAYICYRIPSVRRISAVCLASTGDAWGCLPLTFTCYSLILLTINPAVYIHNTMLSNTSLHAASKYTQLHSKATQAVYPAQ